MLRKTSFRGGEPGFPPPSYEMSRIWQGIPRLHQRNSAQCAFTSQETDFSEITSTRYFNSKKLSFGTTNEKRKQSFIRNVIVIANVAWFVRPWFRRFSSLLFDGHFRKPNLIECYAIIFTLNCLFAVENKIWAGHNFFDGAFCALTRWEIFHYANWRNRFSRDWQDKNLRFFTFLFSYLYFIFFIICEQNKNKRITHIRTILFLEKKK